MINSQLRSHETNRRRVSDNNNISQLLRDSFSVSHQPPIWEPPSHYSMIQIQMYSVIQLLNSVGAVPLICSSFSLLCININAPSPETYLFIFTWTLLWAKAIAYKNHFTVVEDNIRWEIFFENWNKSWDILMDICVWIMQISILKQYLQMKRRSVFFIFLAADSSSSSPKVVCCLSVVCDQVRKLLANSLLTAT